MDPDGPRTTTLPALLGGLRRAVVSIQALDAAGATLREGHGFLFGDLRSVLTERSLLRGARGARVRGADGREFSLRAVLAEDRGGGLVALRTAPPAAGTLAAPLRASGETPSVGDRVALLCGAGEPWPGFRMGTVSAVRHVPLSGTVLEITAHVFPSGSGCPVVNLRGEMVGVALGRRLGGRDASFAVPAERLMAAPAAAVPLPAWKGGAAGEEGAEALRDRGLAHLWAEEHAEALACFSEAAALDPGDGETAFRTALCLEALGRDEEATRACRGAVEAAPALYEALVLLGDLLAREGRHGEAAEARTRAVRLRPGDAEARYFLGDSLGRLHRNAEAAASLREAVRLDPSFVTAWYRLGELLSRLGRHAEEAEAFRRVTVLRPRLAAAHNNLGFALFRLGRPREAVDAYLEAVRIAPDFVVAHDNLGFAWYSMGRHEEAVRAYEEAIRVMPDFAEAHNNRGAALAAWGKGAEAADAYRHAVRIRPDFAEAWYNLGSVLLAEGRFGEAVRPLHCAVRVRPGYAEAHFALGAAFVRLRQRGFAMEQHRLLRALDPALADRLRRLLSPRAH